MQLLRRVQSPSFVKKLAGLLVLIGLVSYLVFITSKRSPSPAPEPEVIPMTIPSIQQRSGCTWTFERYEPSQHELRWLEITQNDTWGKNACPFMHSSAEKATTDTLVAQTLKLINGGTLEADNAKFYSRMIYKCHRGTGPGPEYGIQLIEPLAGILRDPCDKWCPGSESCAELRVTNGQSKRHMLPMSIAPFALVESPEVPEVEWLYHVIPPWFCASQQMCTNTTALTMDIGASYFSNWRGAIAANAGAWLYQFYHKHHYQIRHYFAYEAQKLDAAETYRQLPDDLVAAYRWINVPVSADKDSKLNPWNALRYMKQNNQHTAVTVVKLDIDSPSIEGPLSTQLIEAKGLGITEFYYEHHVNLVPLNRPWGGGRFKFANQTPNLLTSYHLFATIRQLGVRSHSWP